jgi:hypothetical protein
MDQEKSARIQRIHFGLHAFFVFVRPVRAGLLFAGPLQLRPLEV